MQSKNLIPVSIQRSATTFGLSTDLLARLPVLLILWSTCWLLTGCGMRSSLTPGPRLQTQPSNQACHVRQDDLSQESSEETFRKFFAERRAEVIWNALYFYFGNAFQPQDVNMVIDDVIYNDGEVTNVLLKQNPTGKANMRNAIALYIDIKQQEAAFRNFLFANNLDAVWNTLQSAKINQQRTLDLHAMLENYNSAVQSLVIQGVFNFIAHHLPGSVELDLTENELTQLPDTFAKLTNLHELDLSDNQLTELPKSFGKLINLKILGLDGNQLTELPKSFGKLINLKILGLDGNQLTQLPDSFGNLRQLERLYLGYNQLTHLPATFGNLINLIEVNLHKNQLTNLPPSFANLKKLQGLDLSKNQLTHLPATFGNLINLEILCLYNNQLTVLPGCLQKLTKLRVFKVDNNPFLKPSDNFNKPNYNFNAIGDLLTTTNLPKLLFPSLIELAAKRIVQDKTSYNTTGHPTLPHDCISHIQHPKTYPVVLFIRGFRRGSRDITFSQSIGITIALSYQRITNLVKKGEKVILIKQIALNRQSRQ